MAAEDRGLRDMYLSSRSSTEFVYEDLQALRSTIGEVDTMSCIKRRCTFGNPAQGAVDGVACSEGDLVATVKAWVDRSIICKLQHKPLDELTFGEHVACGYLW